MSRQNRQSWVAQRSRRPRTPRSRQYALIGSSYARRLRVEALEDRRLLAAVTVANNLDVVNGTTTSIAALIAAPGSDGISLREAVEAANATPGADAISFAATLSGQTIAMSQDEFEITETLTIDAAPLAENLTLDARRRSRVIDFSSSTGNLSLTGLNLTNGETIGIGLVGDGGGIRFLSSGRMTLTASTLSGSHTVGADGQGGGIFSQGAVTLIQSIVSGNYTTGDDAEGGGIFAKRPVTLYQSTLSGNETSGQGAQGGGIYTSGYTPVTLFESTLSGNSTRGGNSKGGGIYTASGAVTLNQSTLSNNFTNFQAGSAGGGIYARFGAVTLNQSTLTGNRTFGAGSHGGGIAAYYGSVALNQSTLSGNSTFGYQAQGGGIFTRSGTVTLNQSTLSGNRTTDEKADGGGIFARGGQVMLTSSTLSGNSTSGANSEGGGIYMRSGILRLDQSTLTANSTAGANAHGGGIFVANTTDFHSLSIRNSIIAGNSVGAGNLGPDLVPDPQGSEFTVDYSLIGTGVTPRAGGNNISTNAPLLGPLADNGGPTKTHAPLPGSPAIDTGAPHAGALHVYELNGSLTDALGGPSLVALGGVLTTTGYQFGPNQGLNLSSAILSENFSVELAFTLDAPGGLQKIIDFHNRVVNTGLYADGTSLRFVNVAVAANVFSPGVPIHLVITRDVVTVTVYANGVQMMQFIDSGFSPDLAKFTGPNYIARFFQDDLSSGQQTQAGGGFVDRIRTFNRGLSASEVQGLLFDQRGSGFARVVDGNSDGSGRMDIGAFEAVPLLVNDAGVGDDGNIYNGITTLREAINQANAIGGADVVGFASSMSGQTIMLGGAELTVRDSLTIDAAPLAANVTIDAQQQSRVMSFSAMSGDLTLSGLTIRNGRTTGSYTDGDGGGIQFLSSGTLTLSQSTLSGNGTMGQAADGGGIFTYTGTITLNQSTVSGNTTAGDSADGGGVYTDSGAVILNNSTVSGNSTAGARGDGGGIFTESGTVTLNLSTISNNNTVAYFARGGGIFTNSGGVTLSQSSVSGNSTLGDQSHGGGVYARLGAVTLNESNLSANSTAGTKAVGGGIFAYSGAVRLEQSTLSGNFTLGNTSVAGGIFTRTGAVTLNQSTLSGNRTTGSLAYGGGILTYRGVVTLNQSTVSGNSTAGPNAEGGGIFAYIGDVTLTSSTLSGNSTAGSSSQGGGIYMNSGELTLSSSTLTGNSTTGSDSDGGGLFIADSNYSYPVTILNSIVAGNTVRPGSAGPDLVSDSDSTLTVDYSLIGTGISPTVGANNISTNVPLLRPLANYGGPTPTHAPLPGSPAIDAADAGAAGAILDQRGPEFPRVIDGNGDGIARMDIGAVEYAEPWTLKYSLYPSNTPPATRNYFGTSVSVSGDRILVGTYKANIPAAETGQAYLYDLKTGQVLRVISNPSPAAGDWFGYSAAIAGDIAVVGAPAADFGGTDSGRVYVFNLVTGAFIALNNPSPNAGDLFGVAVAISGDKIVVGSYKDDADGVDSGRAYVFDTSGAPRATLVNPTPGAGDWFGTSVAIFENTVVVGSPLDDTTGVNSGQVHLFNATTGARIATIENRTPAPGDEFGYAVALSGNTLVVGATGDEQGAMNSGQAYIYDKSGNYVATIANPSPSAGDQFGFSVATDGNTVVVGDVYDNTGASDSGQAHVFSAATGALRATIGNPAPEISDVFGNAVAVSGNFVVVGALGDDAQGLDQGAAYIFVKPSAAFDGNTIVDGNDFLAWQRGLGAPNATRAQGDSDGDADVDASDLAVWKVQFGATGVTSVLAAVPEAIQSTSEAVYAADEHAAEMRAAEKRTTALDAIYAAETLHACLPSAPPSARWARRVSAPRRDRVYRCQDAPIAERQPHSNGPVLRVGRPNLRD